MIVYHSSTIKVEHPDIRFSRRFIDFGKGFYVTHLRDQAVKYANRFLDRGQNAFLNTYELNTDWKTFNVKRFEKYDSEWLDFVADCRKGNPVTQYDIIEGGIANDKVFTTVDLYFSDWITKDEALKRLRYEKPNWQICLCTQEIMDKCLKFIESEEIV